MRARNTQNHFQGVYIYGAEYFNISNPMRNGHVYFDFSVNNAHSRGKPTRLPKFIVLLNVARFRKQPKTSGTLTERGVYVQ